MIISTKNTAADAVVGFDCFASADGRIDNRWRKITHIAVVGSTNPGDFAISLKVGNTTLVENIYNSQGGANVAPNNDDFVAVNEKVKPGVPIKCVVTDAAAGNDVIIALKIVDSQYKKRTTQTRRYYPRRTYYRRY